MEKNKDKIKRLEKEKETLKEMLSKEKARVKKLESDLSISCSHALAAHEAFEAMQIQTALTYGEKKFDENGREYYSFTLPSYDVKDLVARYDKAAGKSEEKNEWIIVAQEGRDDSNGGEV